MKKKRIHLILLSITLIFFLTIIFFRNGLVVDTLGIHLDNPFTKKVHVPDESSKVDNNENGFPDPKDIVKAARVEVKNRTPYESNYFAGGYPPDSQGVCTDVIWRGLRGAGIDLKSLMDEDIKNNTPLYPRTNGKPDPNIDFRRVPNQDVFFQKYCDSLTTELIPGDLDNLKEWQPGDIVVFLKGYQHVGIVSDKRARDGTPYLINNNPPFASEVKLKSFSSPIHAHYRWKY